MSAHQAMEHSEHIQHAGHGHGDEGHGHAKKASGMAVGITMALLGVLLAFTAAKVGGERAELVKTLVEQSDALGKYNAQDVKHRVAMIAVQQLHASIFVDPHPTAGKKDLMAMVKTVERYLIESKLAKAWAESFDPAIVAHTEAQEHYEWGQLAAEVGIVTASVALLLHRREIWFASVGLGVLAIGITIVTWVHTSHEVREAEEKIHEHYTEYRTTRNANKTTNEEDELLISIRRWAGEPRPEAGAEKSEGEKKPEGEKKTQAAPAHH